MYLVFFHASLWKDLKYLPTRSMAAAAGLFISRSVAIQVLWELVLYWMLIFVWKEVMNLCTDLITWTRTAEEPSLLLGVVAKLPVSATLKLVKLSSLQDKYAWISWKFLSNASKSPGFTAWVTLRVTAGVRGWFNQEWRYSCFKMGSWNRFPFPPFAKPSVEAVPEHGTQHPHDFGGSVAMWEFRGMKTRVKFTDRWFKV